MNIKNIAQKLQDWRKQRSSIRELSRLSDRELADLGIRRSDIEFIARTGQRR